MHVGGSQTHRNDNAEDRKRAQVQVDLADTDCDLSVGSMRSTIFVLLLVGAALLVSAVTAVVLLPRMLHNPVPGEVYMNTETGERIVIDDVGPGGEISARYREHNRDLNEMGLSDRGTVSSLIVPVTNEADSLRKSFSYLGEETIAAEPGEVYVFDGVWHAEVPVTVAYVHSIDWLHAKYERVAERP